METLGIDFTPIWPRTPGMPEPDRQGNGTVLAFDFGEKRIGVAVGERELAQAHPLTVIRGEANAERFAAIAALIGEWQPASLIVGLPVALDGTAHAMSARCIRFANQLRGRFGLRVDYADERLSSVEAEERLRESGHDARSAKVHVDAMAAQLILQTYFETRHEARDKQHETAKDAATMPLTKLPDAEAQCAELAELIRPHLQANTVLVGIHSGGAWIAKRLRELLGEAALPDEIGLIDVSFYRDDFGAKGLHPQIKPTSIPFDVEGRPLILVDDVLYTGRTTRAAINELFDYGRPASIEARRARRSRRPRAAGGGTVQHLGRQPHRRRNAGARPRRCRAPAVEAGPCINRRANPSQQSATQRQRRTEPPALDRRTAARRASRTSSTPHRTSSKSPTAT